MKRLSRQRRAILNRLADGQWHTNGELYFGLPEGKIGRMTERVRELRAMGYQIDCVTAKHLREQGHSVPPDAGSGLWYYRLVAPVGRPPSPPGLREPLRALAAEDSPPPARRRVVCSSGSARRKASKQEQTEIQW